MPTRSRKRSPPATRRRALELLEASIDGCTEAIMLAYGFKTELLVEVVNAGLATASIERIVAGGRSRSFDGPDPQARIGFSPIRASGAKMITNVLADGLVVGRIMKAAAAPQGTP